MGFILIMELSRCRCFVNFFAVMRCLLIFCAVLQYSEPPNVLLIAGTEYQDGVREGRGEGEQESGNGRRKAMVWVKQVAV